ncbi:MAG: SsrA-binding protein SmpB [Bacteriovoracia bacterium]
MAKQKQTDNNITYNKNASRNYHLTERLEAGLVLQGTEVKSIRQGNVQLNDSYANIEKGEIYLHHMNISPYKQGNRFNHSPTRPRKLLLHKQEIRKLIGSVVEKGYTLVPVRLYWQKGKVKVELALAKGKTKGDKRQDMKRKDALREMDYARKRGK